MCFNDERTRTYTAAIEHAQAGLQACVVGLLYAAASPGTCVVEYSARCVRHEA